MLALPEQGCCSPIIMASIGRAPKFIAILYTYSKVVVEMLNLTSNVVVVDRNIGDNNSPDANL